MNGQNTTRFWDGGGGAKTIISLYIHLFSMSLFLINSFFDWQNIGGGGGDNCSEIYALSHFSNEKYKLYMI